MDFEQLNDHYVFRYGVDLPFDAEQIEEWLEAEATNSDEQYRYFHRRYTQHLRGNTAPDADFEDMLMLFSGDFQHLSLCRVKAGEVLLSFYFNSEHSRLLGVFPRSGFVTSVP